MENVQNQSNNFLKNWISEQDFYNGMNVFLIISMLKSDDIFGYYFSLFEEKILLQIRRGYA